MCCKDLLAMMLHQIWEICTELSEIYTAEVHKYFVSLDLNPPSRVVCAAFLEGTEGGECIETSTESRLRNSWRSRVEELFLLVTPV